MNIVQASAIEGRLIHNTKVDFMGKNVTYERIFVMQYDNTLPIIAVELYKNGAPYNITDEDISSITMKIRMSKSDMHYVYENILGRDAEILNKVYVEIGYQMTTCEGNVDPILEIIKDSRSAGSTHILLTIKRNPVQNNQIEEHMKSETEMPLAPVAVTGNYNDLINKLVAGTGITISASNIISAALGLKLEVVSVLPEVGEEQTIYLVERALSETATDSEEDLYDEYIWLVEEERYEHIGSTKTDLTNVAKLDQANIFTENGSICFVNNGNYINGNSSGIIFHPGGAITLAMYNDKTLTYKDIVPGYNYDSTGYSNLGSSNNKFKFAYIGDSVVIGNFAFKHASDYVMNISRTYNDVETNLIVLSDTTVQVNKPLKFSGQATIKEENTNLIFSLASSEYYGMYGQGFFPLQNNKDLGSSIHEWNNAYLSYIYTRDITNTGKLRFKYNNYEWYFYAGGTDLLLLAPNSGDYVAKVDADGNTELIKKLRFVDQRTTDPNPAYSWEIYGGQYDEFTIERIYNNVHQVMVKFNGGSMYSERPDSNIGIETKPYKDLYLSGKIKIGSTNYTENNLRRTIVLTQAEFDALTEYEPNTDYEVI